MWGNLPSWLRCRLFHTGDREACLSAISISSKISIICWLTRLPYFRFYSFQNIMLSILDHLPMSMFSYPINKSRSINWKNSFKALTHSRFKVDKIHIHISQYFSVFPQLCMLLSDRGRHNKDYCKLSLKKRQNSTVPKTKEPKYHILQKLLRDLKSAIYKNTLILQWIKWVMWK